MSEKILIEVEGVGVDDFKKQLTDLGREGSRVATELRKQFRQGLRDSNSGDRSGTTMAQEARVAMNSFRQAERERARVAADTEKEIAAARRAAADEAKRAAKEVSAVQAAMAQTARAQRIAGAAQERAAQAQITAAKRAGAAADARFVAEEVKRAAGLRRARVREAQESAKEEAAARREASQAKAMGSKGMGLLIGAVSIIGVHELAADFIELSDSMEQARNRMRVVSGSEQEMNQVMGAMRKTALDNRSEFDLTTSTYARLTRATADLKIGQQANIDMTSTLTKAISVSGATSEEAHATLIQLSQAMASNRLSADEFRSVAEQLPIILDLLADSTGRAKTKLKEMGQQGQLTTAVVTLAILEGQDKIAKMFAKTVPTIAQAWINVGTQARFAADSFNKATGASKTVVEALQWLAGNMNTAAFAAKTLGLMVGVYLVAQVGSAAIALRALALANPWTALAIGAVTVISTMRQYREEILDTLGVQRELSFQKDPKAMLGFSASITNRADRIVYDRDGRAIKYGTPEERDRRAHVDANLDASRAEMHKEAQAEVRAALIKKLKAQQEIDLNKTKKKRGRRPPTFADAVSGLEEDVGEGTLTKRARSQMDEIMKVQDKLNGSLREGDKGYKHLTESEQEYVVALVDSKKKQQDTIATQQALFKLEMDRLDALVAFRKEWAGFTAEYEQDQRRLGRDIKIGAQPGGAGRFPKLTTDTDFARARKQILQGQRTGYLSGDEAQSAKNQLEMQLPNITAPRKAFLTELEGMGKFKSDIDGIFGPDGSIATGFSSAIAHSITFHDSFKKSIHDLGKSIQQEILQTLIQGLIRMSILGMMGGGKMTTAVTTALPAIGTGMASGGYTGDGPRTGISGYHHYGEYVVPAGPTQHNRDLLDSISKGGSAQTTSNRLNVTIINQHGGVQHEVQQMGPNDVYVIAKQAVKEHADRALAASLNDANSPFAKQLTRATNARMQR